MKARITKDLIFGKGQKVARLFHEWNEGWHSLGQGESLFQ